MSRLSARNFRSPAALACFLLTAALGLGLDLWSKHEAFTRLLPNGVTRVWDPARGVERVLVNEPFYVHRLIPRWVHLQPMANQGAVFGIGQGQRGLFLTVSVAAIVFIFYLFATSERHRFYQFILGLLLAGVIGNMYDRVLLGYVRDMIYIFPSRIVLGREVFPWIFNVADSLLCGGVALMLVYTLFAPGRAKRSPDPQTEITRG